MTSLSVRMRVRWSPLLCAGVVSVYCSGLSAQTCTPAKVEIIQGSWYKERYTFATGKAMCLESQCTLTWQHHKEPNCRSKIAKRECVERNFRQVSAKLACL